MNTQTQTPARKTARQTFIDERAAELIGTGWTPATAAKRAAKEWRLRSPQHLAAVARNNAMAAARNERMATLSHSDPLQH